MSARDGRESEMRTPAAQTVKALAREIAADVAEPLRDDAVGEIMLCGLLAVRRHGEATSAERLRKAMKRRLRRWLERQRQNRQAPAPPEGGVAKAGGSDGELRAAIQGLPPAEAAVVWRHIVEGAPLDVVAEELGLAVPLTRYLLQRGAEALSGADEEWSRGRGELSERAFATEARAELARARRRGYSVAMMVLVGPDDPRLQRTAMDAVASAVRASDLVGWAAGGPAVVMPHMRAEDAPAAAERLAGAATDACGVLWCAGWAVFPCDARNFPALVAAAASRATAKLASDDPASRAA